MRDVPARIVIPPPLDRPIVDRWPYLWIDATYMKVREGGSYSLP